MTSDMPVKHQINSRKPGLDALLLTNRFKIKKVTLPHYKKYEDYEEEGKKWFHLDIVPVYKYNHEGLAQYMKGNQIFDSEIRFMNENEYRKVFGEANPQDITGKMIKLSFAIPNEWRVDYDHCSQNKIDGFERREIYSPEFKVSKRPITIVSITPDCHIGHCIPISWGKAHYYLTMLFDEDKFDEIKDLFNAQKGERLNNKCGYFPKKRLPVELRRFDFLPE